MHLRKACITRCLAFNPLPFRLQMVFCLLQLGYEPFDLGSRGRSELLNKRRHLLIGCLHPKHRMGKVTNLAFNSQICGEGLEVRHLRLHGVLSTFALVRCFGRKVNKV
jgi:hypothetical protein